MRQNKVKLNLRLIMLKKRFKVKIHNKVKKILVVLEEIKII